MAARKQKINLVLVTSVVHISSAPLSYSDVRSFQTGRERLDATLDTLRSVRERVPDARVVLIEGSALSGDEEDEMRAAGCDEIHRVSERLSSVVDGPHKSVAEASILLDYLDSVELSSDSFDTVSKISGRYRLTDGFRWDARDARSVLYQCRSEAGYCNTRFYRIPIEFLDAYKRSLRDALQDPSFSSGEVDIETYNIFRAFPEARVVPVLPPAILGVGGHISHSGEFVEDFSGPPLTLVLVQIEDRLSDPFIARMLAANSRIAEEFGFERVFYERWTEDVPPYWAKVFALHRVAHDRPDADLLAWLDSDAVFVQYALHRPGSLASSHPDKSMWISPDAPPRYSAPFCAGAFLLRNDASGRRILDEWKSLYDPSKWRKDTDGKWTTDEPWAGDAYEQGAFIRHLLPRADLGIQTLPYHVFNETSCSRPHPECISIHLAGAYEQDREDSCDDLFDSLPNRRIDLEMFHGPTVGAPVAAYVAALTLATLALVLHLIRQ